jgi:hypothetical protein
MIAKMITLKMIMLSFLLHHIYYNCFPLPSSSPLFSFTSERLCHPDDVAVAVECCIEERKMFLPV